MKFRRRKDIPPPMDPKLPEPQHKGIALPYHLADTPRQFLAWLATYSELSERQRDLIAQWLLGYNSELVGWILLNYGFGGVLEADAISKEVAKNFSQAVREEYKAREDDLFSQLEKEMGEDE